MLSSAEEPEQSGEEDSASTLEGATAEVTKSESAKVSAEAEPEQPKAVDTAAEDERFPLADPGEYYNGLWCGVPHYKCPYCSHGVAVKDGSGSDKIELHILQMVERGKKSHLPALVLKK